MSITLTSDRRAIDRARAATGPGSIREIRVVGRPPEGWSTGDRVVRDGRAYRVEPGSSHRHALLAAEPASGAVAVG